MISTKKEVIVFSISAKGREDAINEFTEAIKSLSVEKKIELWIMGMASGEPEADEPNKKDYYPNTIDGKRPKSSANCSDNRANSSRANLNYQD